MRNSPLVVYIATDGWSLDQEHLQKIEKVGARIIEVYFADSADLADGNDSEKVFNLAPEIDALINSGMQITSALLDRLKKCKIITLPSIGFDNVDIKTATRHGISVENAPGFCTEEVSNQIITMLLCWNRRITQWDRKIRHGIWFTPEPIPRLSHQILGLIGFGGIGRDVCRRVQALGLKVLVYDPFVDAEEVVEQGATPVALEELLDQADYISMQSPLNSETRGFMDHNKLIKMKKTAFLINCSRGGVVEEPDLIKALRDGTIAGAGLDVFVQEPLPSDHPFFAMENVILTPHSAGYSSGSAFAGREVAVDAAIRALNGESPVSVVNPDVLESPNYRMK